MITAFNPLPSSLLLRRARALSLSLSSCLKPAPRPLPQSLIPSLSTQPSDLHQSIMVHNNKDNTISISSRDASTSRSRLVHGLACVDMTSQGLVGRLQSFVSRLLAVNCSHWLASVAVSYVQVTRPQTLSQYSINRRLNQ